MAYGLDSLQCCTDVQDIVLFECHIIVGQLRTSAARQGNGDDLPARQEIVESVVRATGR